MDRMLAWLLQDLSSQLYIAAKYMHHYISKMKFKINGYLSCILSEVSVISSFFRGFPAPIIVTLSE